MAPKLSKRVRAVILKKVRKRCAETNAKTWIMFASEKDWCTRHELFEQIMHTTLGMHVRKHMSPDMLLYGVAGSDSWACSTDAIPLPVRGQQLTLQNFWGSPTPSISTYGAAPWDPVVETLGVSLQYTMWNFVRSIEPDSV